jgi:hypothetical protein
MAATAKETRAERYRRLRAEKISKEELFDFPSVIPGETWRLRKLSLGAMVAMGIIPMHYAAKVAEAMQTNEGDAPKTFADLGFDEKVKTIDIANKVFHYVCVSPRVVENPTGPDEIGFSEVELDDYNAIIKWAMPGGDEANGLNTFPPE